MSNYTIQLQYNKIYYYIEFIDSFIYEYFSVFRWRLEASDHSVYSSDEIYDVRVDSKSSVRAESPADTARTNPFQVIVCAKHLQVAWNDFQMWHAISETESSQSSIFENNDQRINFMNRQKHISDFAGLSH